MIQVVASSVCMGVHMAWCGHLTFRHSDDEGLYMAIGWGVQMGG